MSKIAIPTSEGATTPPIVEAPEPTAGIQTVEIPVSALRARTGMSREELEQDGHHLEVRTSITSGERREMVRLQATLVHEVKGRGRARRKGIRP